MSSLFMLCGAIGGFLLTVILWLNQERDFAPYFLFAPYYIDSILFKADRFVSAVTFAYFIILFSLIGYFISKKDRLFCKILAVVLLILIHFLLAKLGGRLFFSGLLDALRFWGQCDKGS